MKDYYKILEVNEYASKEVIEKAYKILIKRYHPDLYEGEEKEVAQDKVREINEAFQILSDDFLRAQYDRELKKAREEEFIKRQNRYNTNKDEDSKQEQSKKQKINFKWNKKNNSEGQEVRKEEVGSIGNMFNLVKVIFGNKPKKIDFTKLTRLDFIAFGLTILALIIIGIILWFIPFTNGWMRQLIFENPLFSWIGKLF